VTVTADFLINNNLPSLVIFSERQGRWPLRSEWTSAERSPPVRWLTAISLR
jgi:hypothetical protein